MDEINIEGVILTSLKKICYPKCNVFHGMKKSNERLTGFGKAYFSKINYGEIKDWKTHKKRTSNLVVPIGVVTFVIYNDSGKTT